MKILSILLALFLTLQAQSPEQVKIQNMIAEIKNASNEERFIKMNAFKKQLREMNSDARKEAIMALQVLLKAKTDIEHENNDNRPQLEMLKHQKQLEMQHQMQNYNEQQQNGQSNSGGHINK